MEYWETELRNKNRGYIKLIVWQKAMELFEVARRLSFVQAKIDFKLRSQFAEAAQSVASKIAEGYGGRSLNEYIQFLYYALGSLAETLTRGMGLKERFARFGQLHCEVENRLLRLIEKLEQKRGEADWITRIAEDPEDYITTPPLQHSITPFSRAHA